MRKLTIVMLGQSHTKQTASEVGRLSDAKDILGVSRSWIYRMAQRHPGLLKKAGRSTLVDLVLLRQIIASLPSAEIRGRH